MFKLLFMVILIVPSLQAKECERSEYEKQKEFLSICSLESSNKTIELLYGKEACEFPEGNKVDCAYVVTCLEGKKVRRSGVVFRKGSNLSDFCLTAKKSEEGLARKLLESADKEAMVLLKCPVEQKLNIKFIISTKSKDCAFSKFQ